MDRKLPAELWHKVFGNIDSVAHLAQCRLVCKGWNQQVEQSMFRKLLLIESNTRLVQLYHHLEIFCTCGHLIKETAFGNKLSFPDEAPFLLELEVAMPTFKPTSMLLTFSPKINHANGTINNDDFLSILGIIAGDSPNKIVSLKITYSPSFSSDEYLKTLLASKKSLGSIVLSFPSSHEEMHSFINQIGEFPNLTTLILNLPYEASIDGLESILSNCSHLKHLNLNINLNSNQLPEHEPLKQWLTTHIEKASHGINSLHITDSIRCDVLEYLVYKYSNLNSINVDSPRFPNSDNQNLIRTLDALRKVPKKIVRFYAPTKDNFLLSAIEDLTRYDIFFSMSKSKHDSHHLFLTILNLD